MPADESSCRIRNQRWEAILVNSVLIRIRELAIWRRRGERAPHKPLLLLLALGHFQRGQKAVPYSECRLALAKLLREFGPSRVSYHPEYPFWRLQRDGLWTVIADRELQRRQSSTDPTPSELIGANAVGMFPPHIQSQLETSPELIPELAQHLLWDHFPESIHEDVLDAVGLSLEPDLGRKPRDPSFRSRVLVA